ncbi:MAG: class II fructose-bisphosphate aldolase [Pseudomonadota bacterium]
MPLAPLKDVLALAHDRRAFAVGLVCLSWEDAQVFVAAAEAAETPVILSAGPGARRHMPVAIWGKMFAHLAERASVPVVAHLDHGASAQDCQAALEAGFSSVMYDGSSRPFTENLETTQTIVSMSKNAGASVEAEIGVVGYDGEGASQSSNPEEAARMAETGIDALAVSVGNVHLQTHAQAELDWPRLSALAQACPLPLVIHGGSGVRAEDRARMAREHRVRKINIGTELRQVYGRALRHRLSEDAALFDRLAIARAVAPNLIEATAAILRNAWRDQTGA